MGQHSPPEAGDGGKPRKRRLGRWIGLLLLLLVMGAGTYGWVTRKEIARDLITGTLDAQGVEASYDIVSIAPDRQVLANVVIGDPAAPDLTVERVELSLAARFGLPAVSELKLVKPRLFGRYVDGQLSFGQLDPFIFTGSEAPFEFPDMVLHVEDGRALLEGDFGPIGMRLVGDGHLRGGFKGELAAVAPSLAAGGCEISDASLYGTVGIDAERPEFNGPLRFAELACADGDVAIGGGDAQLGLRADRNLADFEGQASLQLNEGNVAGNLLASAEGETKLTWRNGELTAQYDLAGSDLVTAPLRMAEFAVDGTLRASDGFARAEVDADMDGTGVIPGAELDRSLASLESGGQGTLAGELVSQIRRALAVETRSSSFSGNLVVRRGGGRMSVVVPEARLTGASGETLVALTRGQAGLEDGKLPVFSGNLATGGRGLPRISGHVERDGGALRAQLRMQPYAAGSSQLELPQFVLVQQDDGSMRVTGRVLAEGPLPGGFAKGLVLPLAGRISPSGAVTLWSECTPVAFDALTVSNLSLARQRLTLCPPSGGSILRYDQRGLALAAGMPSLKLAGTLGETPLQLESGAIGFAWPGAFNAKDLKVALGPPDTAARFAVKDLSARLGGEVGGTFSGTDVFLNAVPLDVIDASGDWRYAPDGRLLLSGGSFMLQDRESPNRFEALAAQGATLSLADNHIRAEAGLREPESGRLVANVTMRHDLASSVGSADFTVPGLVFDDRLQPQPPASVCSGRGRGSPRTPPGLSCLALGVVSQVAGTVSGSGHIGWDAESVTSSGDFSSDSLDLAAAFGPVEGASGTVHFSDLLGLTTAPAQRIHIAMVNPGIEVYDGDVEFSLVDGALLRLEDASWPFLGGRLTMQPLAMMLGVEEERRYVFHIEGLEAARFIERMELNNLAATGTFDGQIPIVFDAMGNGRLVDGVLSARPPGGSLSYIGQLTYEDLSTMGNLAFGMLRDLDYNEMEVQMNGPLIGELVTKVRFEGIRQGADADTNILTRQIAKLPIELRVNIRAPFYQLIRTMSSLYDPAMVRDPRGLGLIGNNGAVLRNQTDQAAVDARDEAAAQAADESDIQPPESESMP